MLIIKHPSTVFPRYKNYGNVIETTSGSRHLFISGLNGYEPDGHSMPESFWELGVLIRKYGIQIQSLIQHASLKTG